MHIGIYIRQYRESRGWSQEALAANVVGMSQSTISRIENNKQNINLTQTKKLAFCLGLSVEELLHSPQTVSGGISEQESTEALKVMLSAKDDVIAAKNEIIDLLKTRILELENKG